MPVSRRWLSLFVFFLIPASISLADSLSISEFGIDSVGLTLPDGTTPLTGNGIRIGQVETGRPGVIGTDMVSNTNTTVDADLVVIQDGTAITADEAAVSVHATEVASVIISTDTVDSNSNLRSPRGMAPGVLLQSSAFINEGVDGDDEVLLSTQYIAQRGSSSVPVINHSWGKPRPLDFQLDGKTLLTNGFDWIARKHDVLNIVAGNQGFTEIPIPTDHYNGITVALSSREPDGFYRKVDSFNNFAFDATGPRTSVDLLAPGDDIEVATHGDAEFFVEGTSYAAPHVAGTAALLHEYGEFQANAGFGNWSGGVFRQHEVMKAVLMNSADKIKDDGSGKFLGMTRTVLMQGEMNKDDWLDSPAFTDETIPLDEQMGTGHLNAARAFQQWTESPSRNSSNTVTQNNIGWGFGRSRNDGEINKSILWERLKQGRLSPSLLLGTG